MFQEIERKYLVIGNDFKNHAGKVIHITQGYISSEPERTVRIRLTDDKAFITIKGKSNSSGTTRFEWEKEIEVKEAEELLKLCKPVLIKKSRYLVEVGGHTFEIDEFHDENEGLVLAEVELQDEMEEIEKPTWLGKEVTGDKRFYNAFLHQFPLSKWEIEWKKELGH